MRELNHRCKWNESKVKDKERRWGNEDVREVTWRRRRYMEMKKRPDVFTEAENIRELTSRYDIKPKNQRTSNRHISREIKFSYCQRPES